MAQTVTIATVRENARLYADQRPGSGTAFITDAEVDRLIHQAARGELYDLLVAARGHEYFEAISALATVAGSATVDLPADFYEMLSLYVVWGSTEVEPLDGLESVDDRDRYIYPGATWARETPKAFRMRGTVIELFPTPTAVSALELRYVPIYQEGSSFDAVNGWDRLVSLRAAMDMLAVNKLPMGQLEALYERDLARIEMMAADRAANVPARVRDVMGYEEGRFGRGRRNWRYHGMPP